MIVCNRAVKWWDEKVNGAIRVRRKAHARHASSKATTGWEEYAIARKKIKEMAREEGRDMERRGGRMKQR